MSLVALLLAALLMIPAQGLLLQLACAITGERPPPYLQALATALWAGLVAALGTFAFGCTLGLILGLFSRTLAWAAGVGMGFAVAASVYRTRLAVSGGQALAIALVHHLMAWALSAALYAALSLLPL